MNKLICDIRNLLLKIKATLPLFFTTRISLLIFITIAVAVYYSLSDIELWRAIFGALAMTVVVYLSIGLFLATIIGIAFIASKGSFCLKYTVERLSDYSVIKRFLNSRLACEIKRVYPFISCSILAIVCIALFFYSAFQIFRGHYSWVCFLFLLSPMVLFESINEHRAKNTDINKFFIKYFNWLKPIPPLFGKSFLFMMKWLLIFLALWICGNIIVMIPIPVWLCLIFFAILRR